MTRNKPDAGRLRHRRRGRLAAHRLGPARDGIDPHFASGMRRFERLAEMQQSVGAHERIRDFRGCVELPEIDDSLDRCCGRAGCEKLRPILRRFRAQGESVGSGRGKLFAGPCDPAMRSGGAQLRRQLLAQPGGVGENEPRFFRGRFHRRGDGVQVAARPCARAVRSGLHHPMVRSTPAAKSLRQNLPRVNTRSHCARSSNG